MKRLALGTMNFGGRTSAADAARILDRAAEAGVDWLDTANVYTEGSSERIVGDWLKRSGAKLQVATKVGLARPAGKPEGLSRRAIEQACAASLERLQRPQVELYYLHAPDPHTAIEETLEAIASLLEQRQIVAWGVSNFSSWQVLELMQAGSKLKLPAPAASQVMHNLLIRQIEIEHLPFLQRYGIESVTYNPLAGGLLSGGRALQPQPHPGSRFAGNTLYQRRYWSAENFRRTEAYRALAESWGWSLLQLAYAFVMQFPRRGSVLLGPASALHLDAALACAQLTLSESQRAELDSLHVRVSGSDASYAR
jgi:aryl-alcohol dehydrogenase-like predicted oxidoreductase